MNKIYYKVNSKIIVINNLRDYFVDKKTFFEKYICINNLVFCENKYLIDFRISNTRHNKIVFRETQYKVKIIPFENIFENITFTKIYIFIKFNLNYSSEKNAISNNYYFDKKDKYNFRIGNLNEYLKSLCYKYKDLELYYTGELMPTSGSYNLYINFKSNNKNKIDLTEIQNDINNEIKFVKYVRY
jgi:hypothetical protein